MKNAIKLIPILCYIGPVVLGFMNRNGDIFLSKDALVANLVIFILDAVYILIFVLIISRQRKIIEPGHVIGVRYFTREDFSRNSDDNSNCELTVRFVYSGSEHYIKCGL